MINSTGKGCSVCFYSRLSPLQIVNLFLLVVLFIFSLPQDLQKSFHLGLGLSSILFVLGHFLLQAGYAFGEFNAGLGICCCTLSLEQKLDIINKLSFLQLGDHHYMEAARSNWKGYANNNICVEDWLSGFDDKLFKWVIGLWLTKLHPETSLLQTR